MGKKGQVTIFVIVGILIVLVGVLIYLFFPGIRSTLSGANENPQIYMQNCLVDDLEKNIQTISLQGGELNPTNYYLYKDSKIHYSCYTNEYYSNCIVQDPFIKQKIEQELTDSLKLKVNECFDSMKVSYEKKGYTVSMNLGEVKISILPQRTILFLMTSVSVTKKDSQIYDSFNVILNNNLYEVLGIARTIIDHESVEGQIDTTELMSLYRDLKIEKLKQSDGTKIYVITDRRTGDVFNLASRSQALPAGYM